MDQFSDEDRARMEEQITALARCFKVTADQAADALRANLVGESPPLLVCGP